MKILISGAGIAGPGLVLALEGMGHEVTVVERAAALRVGGQSVDFRGEVHRQVLERLGLWNPIWARRTSPAPLAFIDHRGWAQLTLPAVLTAGDVEIVRGDLCRLLYETTKNASEYRFHDEVVELNQRDSKVDVRFASGAGETYDLVVGADGMHSGIRALVFGSEGRFLHHHGYALATFSFERFFEAPEATQSYSEPGRSVTVSAEREGRARALLIFTSPPFQRGLERPAIHEQILRRFSGARWRTAEVLARMPEAEDLYVDSIATVHVDRYSHGRVALLGDAAWGGTLGGQGTPLALTGAWVLTHELRQAKGNVVRALEAFERQMRPYASGCQRNAKNAGPFHAPRTRLGLIARRLFYGAMTSRPLMGQFEKMVKASAGAFKLPAAREAEG